MSNADRSALLAQYRQESNNLTGHMRDPLARHHAIGDVAAGDSSNMWRDFIEKAANPLLTELWDMYNKDCRDRHERPMEYVAFIKIAEHLTHDDLPQYWTLYLSQCEAHEKYPEPFITVMERMQKQLPATPDTSKKGLAL